MSDSGTVAAPKGLGRVQQIHVFPVHGEPGDSLDVVEVGPGGLAGDRPKKAPVMVLSDEDTSGARANFVVGLSPDVLLAAVGAVLRLGDVELEVSGPAGTCPGCVCRGAAAGLGPGGGRGRGRRRRRGRGLGSARGRDRRDRGRLARGCAGRARRRPRCRGRSARRSYHAIPAGAPVRLAKRTSNLFRARAATSTPGLDVSGLDGVVHVDPVTRTADVQGVCTYEHLVDATLPHGLVPLVVPQLKTITLGGAVTGLGIESTSFRSGLPHESVVEMDILTGAGEVVTARPEGEHADLFRGFPNSYGTLGYATRLRITLEDAAPTVALRHVRFHDVDSLVAAVGAVVDDGAWEGSRSSSSTGWSSPRARATSRSVRGRRCPDR